MSEPAPGFTRLSENKEIALMSSGEVLMFQGHPEPTIKSFKTKSAEW